jgi:hypothetical protein
MAKIPKNIDPTYVKIPLHSLFIKISIALIVLSNVGVDEDAFCIPDKLALMASAERIHAPIKQTMKKT